MKSILTVNGGSSSLKCGLYSIGADNQLTAGCILKLGNLLGHPVQVQIQQGDHERQTLTLDLSESGAEQRHQAALGWVLTWIEQNLPEHQLIATGHRIVHGGDRFSAPTHINDDVMSQLLQFIPLAPLHQPYNLKLIDACRELAPDLPVVGCFDTMFHSQQPELERLYAIPRQMTEAGIHKYGFHGLSYEYIQRQLVKAGSGDLNTIVCHLGAGASMCAIRDGHSIASSMGFTAVEGLPMGSRSGNIDPGVLLYLMREYGMDADALETFLYKECGWQGVSGGISSEMLALHAAQHPHAEEAIDLFCYRVALETGRLAAALGGVQQVVFTGGVGENDADVRARIIARYDWLGAKLDETANHQHQPIISTPDSALLLRVMPTDEERMIAQQTHEQLEMGQA